MSIRFYLLFLISLFMSIGNNITLPIVSLYLDSFGLDIVKIGNVVSIFAVTVTLGQLFAGPLLNSRSKKLILQSAIVIIASSMFLMAFSHDLRLIALARGIHGLGVSFAVTSCLALVTEAVDDSIIAKALSIYGLAEVLTSSVGPSIVTWLIGLIGYQKIFILCGCFLLCALFITFTISYHWENKPLVFSLSGIFLRETMLPFGATVLQYVASNIVSTFILIYIVMLKRPDPSLFFAIQSVALLLSKPLLNRLMDHIRKEHLLIYGLFISLAAYLLLATGKAYLLLLAAVVFGLTNGSVSPLLQSLCIDSTDKEHRGSSVAMSYLGVGIGGFIGANLGGQLIDMAGYRFAFVSAIVFVLVEIGLVYIYRRKTQ